MLAIEAAQTTVKADFSPKLKFALTLGTNAFIGLLGVAATVGVAVYLAKSEAALLADTIE